MTSCKHEDCYELRCLNATVEEDLKEELKGKTLEELEDFEVSEFLDGYVPVYTADLLHYALSNLWLAVEEPEVLAFDGKTTVVNIIAGNLYHELEETAYEYLNARKEDFGREIQTKLEEAQEEPEIETEVN